MYPMENIIWLVIAALGVISAITNKGKSKSKDKPSSMPTFGGSGERSLRPIPPRESDNSDDRMEDRNQQEVYTHRDMDKHQPLPTFESEGRSVMDIPDFDKNFSPSPNYDTGEGVSQMWQDTMQDRNREMQRDIDRVTAALDKISAPSSKEWNAYDNSDEELSQSYSSNITNQAVSGIVWSEILGPPRAKRPYSNRKS